MILERGCDFCGKSQNDVDLLITGQENICICNGCVVLCVDILTEKLGKKTKEQPNDT